MPPRQPGPRSRSRPCPVVVVVLPVSSLATREGPGGVRAYCCHDDAVRRPTSLARCRAPKVYPQLSAGLIPPPLSLPRAGMRQASEAAVACASDNKNNTVVATARLRCARTLSFKPTRISSRPRVLRSASSQSESLAPRAPRSQIAAIPSARARVLMRLGTNGSARSRL